VRPGRGRRCARASPLAARAMRSRLALRLSVPKEGGEYEQVDCQSESEGVTSESPRTSFLQPMERMERGVGAGGVLGLRPSRLALRARLVVGCRIAPPAGLERELKNEKKNWLKIIFQNLFSRKLFSCAHERFSPPPNFGSPPKLKNNLIDILLIHHAVVAKKNVRSRRGYGGREKKRHSTISPVFR